MLPRAERPLSSSEICDVLAVKPGPLRDDISHYKDDLLDDGVELCSQQGLSYHLVVNDENKYILLIMSLLKMEQRRHFVLPVRHDHRLNYLVRTFLSADNYILLDDIAEELCISRSTLNNTMRDVRQQLETFGLILAAKPASGIKLIGRELSIRQAIARYFFYGDHVPYSADTGFQNLVIHLEITLMRIDKRHCDVASGGWRKNAILNALPISIYKKPRFILSTSTRGSAPGREYIFQLCDRIERLHHGWGNALRERAKTYMPAILNPVRHELRRLANYIRSYVGQGFRI